MDPFSRGPYAAEASRSADAVAFVSCELRIWVDEDPGDGKRQQTDADQSGEAVAEQEPGRSR